MGSGDAVCRPETFTGYANHSDSIFEETVRQRLKNDLKPHRSEYWLIPPKENTEFAYRMETILLLYQEPYDENSPVICFDESSKELRKHTRDPPPANRERSPGRITTTNARGTNASRSGRTADWVVSFEVILVSPGLGEHTRKELAKFAYDEEEIDRLLDEGVV